METIDTYDYIIIGAGPAGLQLAYYLQKHKRSYVVLEAGSSPGSFFKTHPRHRQLLSINKVHAGVDDPDAKLRWDWNSLLNDEGILFSDYSSDYFPSADDLVDYLEGFSAELELNIHCQVQVINISKRSRKFHVLDKDGRCWMSKRLIVATGVQKQHVPPVPGIELAESYAQMSVRPEDFADQKVLIIGKGNSAFETADHLTGTTSVIHVVSPSPLRLAWQSRYVGDLRAVNNDFVDTYLLKSRNAILDAHVLSIRKDGGKYVVRFRYIHSSGEEEEITYDRVLLCAGFKFDSSLFDPGCEVDLRHCGRLPRMTEEWESTSVKGLYFAGVLMSMRDYRKTTSAFIHGFRYCVKALATILEIKYHRKQWVYEQVESDSSHITEKILQRANTASDLWQQFGFFCDVIVPETCRPSRYYSGIPRDYVMSGKLGDICEYFTCELEFGEEHGEEDPFSSGRISQRDYKNAHLSQQLHPIIRHYRDGVLVNEHHVVEDLVPEWNEDIHMLPLQHFLEEAYPAYQKQGRVA